MSSEQRIGHPGTVCNQWSRSVLDPTTGGTGLVLLLHNGESLLPCHIMLNTDYNRPYLLEQWSFLYFDSKTIALPELQTAA